MYRRIMMKNSLKDQLLKLKRQVLYVKDFITLNNKDYTAE